MMMMKPSRLLASALFCATLGFAYSANASTIDIGGGAATLDCGDKCFGFIGGGSPGSPSGTGTLDIVPLLTADLYAVSPSSPTNETLALATLLGFDPGTPTVVDIGSLSGFASDAIYFMLKLGADSAFFENTSGMSMVLSLSSTPGRGAGLSHITTWGVIPLPAALPMFLLALGGAALVARRRRGVADAA
jgi:hypothetical protein